MRWGDLKFFTHGAFDLSNGINYGLGSSSAVCKSEHLRDRGMASIHVELLDHGIIIGSARASDWCIVSVRSSVRRLVNL